MSSTQTTAVPVARGAPDGAAALPGTPFPLDATPGEQVGVAGTNFAIASSVADPKGVSPGNSTSAPVTSAQQSRKLPETYTNPLLRG